MALSQHQHQRVLREQLRQRGSIEHMCDNFSPSCPDICDQKDVTLNPALQEACDTGSQAYCTIPANIVSGNCVSYVARVIGTRAAESKTIPEYKNPVIAKAPKTVADYYNALGDTAVNYISSNISDLSSEPVNAFMVAAKAEGGSAAMYNKVADAAIAKCMQSTQCTTPPSWLTSRVADSVTERVATYQTASVGTILDYLKTNVATFLKFEDLFAPLLALALSKLTINDISHPSLMVLRGRSLSVRTAVDLFIINFICDTQATKLQLMPSGDYETDLSSKPKLYASVIETFIATLKTQVNAATDKLLVAYNAADTKNLNRCQTTNPLQDATCVAMQKSSRPTVVAAIDAALSSYCSTATAAIGDSCVSYVNTLQNGTAAKAKALENAYKASVDSSGIISKAVLDRYGEPMLTWLKGKTADKYTLDASGNTVITSTCGTEASLPITLDQCKQICSIYPSVCLDDEIKRAQLPQYRYAKEGFGIRTLGHTTICSPDEDDISVVAIIIVIFAAIAFAFMFLHLRRRMMEESFRRIREDTLKRMQEEKHTADNASPASV